MITEIELAGKGKKGYVCPQCGHVHDNKFSALECYRHGKAAAWLLTLDLTVPRYLMLRNKKFGYGCVVMPYALEYPRNLEERIKQSGCMKPHFGIKCLIEPARAYYLQDWRITRSYSLDYGWKEYGRFPGFMHIKMLGDNHGVLRDNILEYWNKTIMSEIYTTTGQLTLGEMHGIAKAAIINSFYSRHKDECLTIKTIVEKLLKRCEKNTPC